MNQLHKQRFYTVIFLMLGFMLAISLILYALKQNINAFFTPSQLAATQVTADYHFRLGGMVEKGSIVHDPHGLGVDFIVTDYKSTIRVRYVGVLPDLFREGEGVIVDGQLNGHGMFIASQVLAKHDANYMPKNVYAELQKNKTLENNS